MMTRITVIPLTVLALLWLSHSAPAQEEAPSFGEKLKQKFDLDPRTGFFGYHRWKYQPSQTQDEHLQRTGCPNSIAPWTRCPDDRRYVGYYVGGGAAFGGEPRYCDEGTWGWDYALPWTRVKLGWFHGRRHQGGEGQYNPDRNNNPADDFTNP